MLIHEKIFQVGSALLGYRLRVKKRGKGWKGKSME
jgi:hypothetical protein